MYKIFINDKPFVITSTDVDNASLRQAQRMIYEPATLIQAIRDTESMKSKGTILIAHDVEEAFNDFYTHHVPVKAAGGVVFSSKQDLLLIKRMGKWDLPKGKIDAGEQPEEAALREVEEECGLSGLRITDKLPLTYHTYKMHNYRFLKLTYWFKMHTDFEGELKPQVEEMITEVIWKPFNKLSINELDTYDSIRDLLREVVDV